MLAPYENEPDNRGIVVTDKEEMMSYAEQASAAGLSLTVHAIGDRANHDVLDVFETLRLRANQGLIGGQQAERLRHRIEHFQIVHPADFRRLAALGVVASMQESSRTFEERKENTLFGSVSVTFRL